MVGERLWTRLTSGLTTSLGVVLSFLVLNTEPPEAPKHLVGLPHTLPAPVTPCPRLWSPGLPVFTRLYTSTGPGPHPVLLCVPHSPFPDPLSPVLDIQQVLNKYFLETLLVNIACYF